MILITRYQALTSSYGTWQNSTVDGMCFKRVNTYKYLGKKLNVNRDNQMEIKQRINAANPSFFALNLVFNSICIYTDTYISYMYPNFKWLV